MDHATAEPESQNSENMLDYTSSKKFIGVVWSVRSQHDPVAVILFSYSNDLRSWRRGQRRDGFATHAGSMCNAQHGINVRERSLACSQQFGIRIRHGRSAVRHREVWLSHGYRNNAAGPCMRKQDTHLRGAHCQVGTVRGNTDSLDEHNSDLGMNNDRLHEIACKAV